MVFVTPRAVAGYSPVDVTAGRYVACGLFAVAVMLFMSWRGSDMAQRTLPTARQAAVALGLSVLGYTGYYLVLALAIGDAGSVLPTLIIGTIPLWMMVLGKPDHLHWRGLWPGFVLTAMGLGVMVWAEQAPTASHAAEHAHFWRGMGFAGLAMLSWTAFGLLNAAVLKRDPTVRSSDWANWMGIAAGVGGLAMWFAQGSEWDQLVQRDDFGLFLYGHWGCVGGIGAVERGQPPLEPQPGGPAHRQRDGVWCGVFLCVGRAVARAGAVVGLRAVCGGHPGIGARPPLNGQRS